MDWTLEVVVLPVNDIGRSIAFYRDQVGFELDHETHERAHARRAADAARLGLLDRVRRSALAQREMEPGSMRALQLCVADAPGRPTTSSSSRGSNAAS